MFEALCYNVFKRNGDKIKVSFYKKLQNDFITIQLLQYQDSSFHKELKAFQKKYGMNYFSFINEVRPHFTKKAPKNKLEYFLLLPMRIKKNYILWLCGIGITALMLPQIIYIVYCGFINPAPNEWTLILGLIGTFIMP